MVQYCKSGSIATKVTKDKDWVTQLNELKDRYNRQNIKVYYLDDDNEEVRITDQVDFEYASQMAYNSLDKTLELVVRGKDHEVIHRPHLKVSLPISESRKATLDMLRNKKPFKYSQKKDSKDLDDSKSKSKKTKKFEDETDTEEEQEPKSRMLCSEKMTFSELMKPDQVMKWMWKSVRPVVTVYLGRVIQQHKLGKMFMSKMPCNMGKNSEQKEKGDSSNRKSRRRRSSDSDSPKKKSKEEKKQPKYLYEEQ